MGRPVVDLTGKKVGKLTVIKMLDEDYVTNSGIKKKQWLCKCECGNDVIFTSDSLKGDRHVKSCGCLNKKDNIVGKRFGKLLVTEEIKTNKNKYRYKCICDCGNELELSRYALTSNKDENRSCPKCRDKSRPDRLKDITGERYGMLTALYRSDENYYSKGGVRFTQWVCKCDCGNIVTVKLNSLTIGKTKSCGCLYYKDKNMTKEEYLEMMEKAKMNTGEIRDITGQRFGKLVAIKRIDKKANKQSRKKAYWLCKCDCGSYGEYILGNLVNGHTQSCGCIDSVGEMRISQIFDSNNIRFKKEVRLDKCRDNKTLPFDFGLYDKDWNLICLIEYDGKQHFEKVRFNGMSEDKAEESFFIGKKHDDIKTNYCDDNNIPLLRIKYTEYDNIEKIINEFISTVEGVYYEK